MNDSNPFMLVMGFVFYPDRDCKNRLQNGIKMPRRMRQHPTGRDTT